MKFLATLAAAVVALFAATSAVQAQTQTIDLDGTYSVISGGSGTLTGTVTLDLPSAIDLVGDITQFNMTDYAFTFDNGFGFGFADDPFATVSFSSGFSNLVDFSVFAFFIDGTPFSTPTVDVFGPSFGPATFDLLDATGFALAEVTVDVTNIPTPATLPLLLSGLGLLVFATRRRRA